jgi:aldose 1-epimerase
MPSEATLVLESTGARLEIDPLSGGRVSSLEVNGSELFATAGTGRLPAGCFPMVPYAGRVREGRFEFRGRRVDLPRNLGSHAGHGTVFDRAWNVVDDRSLAIDLGPSWPFRGRVVQQFELDPGEMRLTLTIEADEPMPGAVGWHPWFRRRLSGTTAQPAAPSPAADLRFDPAWMLQRDAAGIPTGELVEPTVGPWDDCFTGLRSTPTLTWPGVLSLELTSSCDFWVVYDEPAETICLEPQSSPPNFVNADGPPVVEPGRPLTATMTWRWRAAEADIAR